MINTKTPERTIEVQKGTPLESLKGCEFVNRTPIVINYDNGSRQVIPPSHIYVENYNLVGQVIISIQYESGSIRVLCPDSINVEIAEGTYEKLRLEPQKANEEP